MVRPRKIKLGSRMTSTIVYDSDVYREFERLVGAGNVSEEIRAMMADRVEQSKKEEGLLTPDPLNLLLSSEIYYDNNRKAAISKQHNIFEYFPPG